jgi:hypothetical protein
MEHIMKRLMSALLLTCSIAGHSPLVAEDAELAKTREQLMVQFVVGASMQLGEFNRFASGSTLLKPSEFDNQPLTLLFWQLPGGKDRTDQQKKEFDMRGDRIPKPSRLASAILPRAILPICSVIQLKYIKEFTCEVKGNTATGVIKVVAAPYHISPHYIASLKDGKWKVVEFSLPAYKTKTVLGEKGRWKIESSANKSK